MHTLFITVKKKEKKKKAENVNLYTWTRSPNGHLG